MAIAAGSTAVICLGAQAAGVAIEPVAIGGAVAASAVGALAPDLDHPGSLASFGIPTGLITYGVVFLAALAIQKRLPGPQILDLSALGAGFVPAAWTAIVVGVFLLVLSFAAGAFFKHRGPVHSIAFGLIATLVVGVGLLIFRAPLWLALPFAWGWATHLFADATTKMGLPSLLWPLGSDIVSRDGSAAPTASPRPVSQTAESVPVPTPSPVPVQPTADSQPVCPKCGIPMVLRTASKGEHRGRRFYGCSNFPRCRQTRALG